MSKCKPPAPAARLWYVANARVPSEKAHVLQIFKMCQSFAQAGFEVTLIHPHRRNNKRMRAVNDVWDYYQVGREFTIQQLWSLDWPWLEAISSVLWFRLQALSFMLGVRRYLGQRAAPGLIYSRDIYSTLWLIRFPIRRHLGLVYEAHDYPKRIPGWQVQQLNQGLAGLVVVNEWLKEKWIELGFPADKILVAQDGVDLAAFQPRMSKQEARRKLGLAENMRLVLYAGHLYPWKGVYTLATATRYLPPDYRVCFLGGMPKDKADLESYCKREDLCRVQFLGHVSPGEVSEYLSAADILVLPNSGKDERSRCLTSPLKLFEYLAIGRPLVAADLPSLREVLQDGREALLFIPDDPQSLAQQVIRVAEDRELAQRLSQAGVQQAKNFSWEKRAANIKEFVEHMLGVS